jgi:hypothetical protein
MSPVYLNTGGYEQTTKRAQENSNKQMNKIKKTMKNIKEKINKDIEILKNN